MSLPERSPERDAAILALLPHAGLDGWTIAALVAAAGRDADLLFPGGAADLIEAYCDLADRWMEQDAAAEDMADARLPQRVRAVILGRFARNAQYKDAVRRAVGALAMPGRAVLAARCTGRTVDAIWHAAGDVSSDFSWYTKRATLVAVYGATLLFWLHDSSEGAAATADFLDRRLAGVARVGALRRRLTPANFR